MIEFIILFFYYMVCVYVRPVYTSSLFYTQVDKTSEAKLLAASRIQVYTTIYGPRKNPMYQCIFERSLTYLILFLIFSPVFWFFFRWINRSNRDIYSGHISHFSPNWKTGKKLKDSMKKGRQKGRKEEKKREKGDKVKKSMERDIKNG